MWSYFILIFTALFVNFSVRMKWIEKAETMPALEALVFAVVVYWASSWSEFFSLMAVLVGSQFVFSPLAFSFPTTLQSLRDVGIASILISAICAVFSMIFGGLTYGIQTLFF